MGLGRKGGRSPKKPLPTRETQRKGENEEMRGKGEEHSEMQEK